MGRSGRRGRRRCRSCLPAVPSDRLTSRCAGVSVSLLSAALVPGAALDRGVTCREATARPGANILPLGLLRGCAAALLPLRPGSHSAKSRRRAGRACGNELSRPGFLDQACDQEGRGVPLPDGRDRAAHHVRAVPQAEQAALPRSPDGCAVGWRWLRARSRRHRWRVEGDGGATSILGGRRPQSAAGPLCRPGQDRSSTKPRQAGASEPMTRKARKAARF